MLANKLRQRLDNAHGQLSSLMREVGVCCMRFFTYTNKVVAILSLQAFHRLGERASELDNWERVAVGGSQDVDKY